MSAHVNSMLKLGTNAKQSCKSYFIMITNAGFCWRNVYISLCMYFVLCTTSGVAWVASARGEARIVPPNS